MASQGALPNVVTTATIAESSQTSRLPPLTHAPALRLSTDELRGVVLDYLTTSTYIDTARAFVRQLESSDACTSLCESDHPQTPSTCARHAGMSRAKQDSDGTCSERDTNIDEADDDIADTTLREANGHHQGSALLPDADVRQIRVRRDICNTIRGGAIQAAIDQCNLHFPAVLATPASMAGVGSNKSHVLSKSVPHITYGANASRPVNGRMPQPSKAPHIPTFSTDPVSLTIALQLQLFIEIVRQSAALHASAGQNNMPISRPTTPFSAAQSPISVNGSLDGSTASLASTASSSMSYSSGTSATGSTSALSEALSLAQNLYAQIDRLPDPAVRQIHRLELESVSGLLPYHDPSQSPVSYYLNEKRRDALAEALNGAILLSLGRSSTRSKLGEAVRQNNLIWRSLHELKSTYPPDRGSVKGKAPRAIQPFDLDEFLSTNVLA